jgi:hypothetical protein
MLEVRLLRELEAGCGVTTDADISGEYLVRSLLAVSHS